LQTLRNEEVPVSRAELVKLLEAASKAVLEDAVWECSGIDNLLQRASQRARAECPHTARTEALALLGFHQQRNVLLSGISGTSSGSAADLQEQGEAGNVLGGAVPGSSTQSACCCQMGSGECADPLAPGIPPAVCCYPRKCKHSSAMAAILEVRRACALRAVRDGGDGPRWCVQVGMFVREFSNDTFRECIHGLRPEASQRLLSDLVQGSIRVYPTPVWSLYLRRCTRQHPPLLTHSHSVPSPHNPHADVPATDMCLHAGKLSSGSASPSSDEDAAQPDAAVSLDAPASPTGHTLKRRRADAGSSATSTDHSFSVPSSQKRPRQEQQPQQPQQQGEEGFAVPRLLPRRRVTGAVGSMPTMYGLPHLSCPSISARGGAVLTQQSPQQHWCGPMNLHLEDFSSSELCQAQVQLPAGVSRHVLPPRLIFTHIVQRRGVTLGKHHVSMMRSALLLQYGVHQPCRCSSK